MSERTEIALVFVAWLVIESSAIYLMLNIS